MTPVSPPSASLLFVICVFAVALVWYVGAWGNPRITGSKVVLQLLFST